MRSRALYVSLSHTHTRSLALRASLRQIYGLEILVIRRRIGAREAASGYYESLWRTLWVLIQGETFGVSMIPARLVVATFAFFALILSSSYTANLAAFLTTQSYGGVRNIFDLRGSAVSTVEVYRDALMERYRLQPSIADISNLDAVRMEAEKILDGDLSAVVIDTVVAGYIVAEASGQGCPWRLLPDTYVLYRLLSAVDIGRQTLTLDRARIRQDPSLPVRHRLFAGAGGPCHPAGVQRRHSFHPGD